MIERKALIFNIQKYNMYDGPGVRTLVFFKGCPLRCQWCSNPEGQRRGFEVLFKKEQCVLCGACVAACPVGIHRLTPGGSRHEMNHEAECIGCRECERVCPGSALAVAGEAKTMSELLAIIEEDRPFYETSGGGVTIGGGEALMQPEAVVNLLMACKRRGLNTAMETCGYARPEVLQQVAEFVDMFLYDIKHMDPDKHREMTGVRTETILTNVQWLLDNRHHVKIRVPLLKGFNDGEDNLRQMAAFLEPWREARHFHGVDLLPYHKLGVNKYVQLEQEYPLKGDPSLSEADLDRVAAVLKAAQLPVTVVRH